MMSIDPDSPTTAEPRVEPGSRRERSGLHSRDPQFDPAELFVVLDEGDNSERATQAMREYLDTGDVAHFDRAVAVYVRSARARGIPVEQVLAALNRLSDAQVARYSQRAGTIMEPSELQRRVVEVVLKAFYGDTG